MSWSCLRRMRRVGVVGVGWVLEGGGVRSFVGFVGLTVGWWGV